MKRLALTAALLLPLAAHAQSTALSQSGAASFSQSGSSGAAVTYAPSSTYTDRPTAIAPDLGFASANACGLAGGAGAAGGGWFALNFGMTKESKRCGHFNDAQGWSGMGLNIVAIGMLCKNPDDADTFLRVYGVPCPGQPGAPAAPLPPALSYLNPANK
jgi:hypothetical protein